MLDARVIAGAVAAVAAMVLAIPVVVVGRLFREGPFDRIWIQPAAGDAGGALGAAMLVWHQMLGNRRAVNSDDSQKGSFLGPAFANEDCCLFLDSVDARYTHYADEDSLLLEVARLLANGNIVGWFHGRMEYGPRSLGARSILGDPRSTRMQQDMNLKIKFRESFRPFAPCILREHAHEVVDLPPNCDSPYMLFVSHLRPELRKPLSIEDKARLQDPDLRVRLTTQRSTLPAITHLDYSARVQTVDEKRHGRFYRLMQAFYGLTGCPVVVNTSFNIRGEPIVCTPEDAYRCFIGTKMDCLVLEDCILMKALQPADHLVDEQSYKEEYALD